MAAFYARCAGQHLKLTFGRRRMRGLPDFWIRTFSESPQLPGEFSLARTVEPCPGISPSSQLTNQAQA